MSAAQHPLPVRMPTSQVWAADPRDSDPFMASWHREIEDGIRAELAALLIAAGADADLVLAVVEAVTG